MSLTFAATYYLHDVKVPRLPSLSEIQIPRIKRPKELQVEETERLFTRELDNLENHVPSATNSIFWDPEPTLAHIHSQKVFYQKLDKEAFRVRKEEQGFISRNTYSYTPLAPNTIRLLRFRSSSIYFKRITIDLIDVSLDSLPQYEALSYRWSSILGSHKVTCNGGTLLVSKNCQMALKRLREENRLLWVDAICINQQDKDERKSQVALMPQIYSKAERTLAWLGEDEDLGASRLGDIESAAPYLKLRPDVQALPITQSAMRENAILALLQDDTLRPSLSFSKLLQRPWFRRIWILQEVALAKDIWIYCGDQRTTWIAFSGVLKALKMKSKLSSKHRAVSNLVAFRNLYRQRRTQGGIDIHLAIVQARQCEATDPRDKVYALLGVCEELRRYVGEADYGLTIASVWTRAQRACLASHLSINALSLVSVGQSLKYGIPSWVPDLSTMVRTWPRRPPSATATDGAARIIRCSSMNSNCLHAWATAVDSIALVCRNTAGDHFHDHIRQWRQWWQKFMSLDTNEDRGSDDKIFAFWSTLYCDVHESVPRTGELLRWHRRVLKEFWTMEETTKAFRTVRAADFVESTSNRVFGVTTKGSIGLFTSKAQTGDQVFLFKGGTMPFLMRPTMATVDSQQGMACAGRNLNAYQLIGPCYVYGFTDSSERVKERSSYREILLL